MNLPFHFQVSQLDLAPGFRVTGAFFGAVLAADVNNMIKVDVEVGVGSIEVNIIREMF